MMDGVQYKHHWTIDRKAWYLRLYLAMWHADPSEVNFCKLFWGYFPPFFVLNLLAHLFLGPIFLAMSYSVDKIEYRRRLNPKPEWSGPPPPQGPNVFQRFLEFASAGWTKFSLAFSSTWAFLTPRWVRRAFVFACFAILGIGCIAATGLIIYFAIRYFHVTVLVLAAALAAVFVVGIIAVLAAMNFFSWAANRLMRPTGHTLRDGTLGFFGMLRVGFYAVKGNTCPRVEVAHEHGGHRASDAQTTGAPVS